MKNLPKEIISEKYKTSHVQGIAVDGKREYIYYSFTTVLIKSDLSGKVVGSVEGLTGHLGCLAMNYKNGKVYGTLEYKSKNSFYVAIFDVDKIDRMHMSAEKDGIMKTVYLKEVVDDYTADMDKNGIFDGDREDSLDHRYGCSGIDGITFGKIPGAGEKEYLWVAYGIYSNLNRADNDYQVFLLYDTENFEDYGKPLNQLSPHTSCPERYYDKYFLYTGNTNYGVQNLEYDKKSGNYYVAVYTGYKPQYKNYAMFIIDGKVSPKLQELKGQNGELGKVLSLVKDGNYDEQNDIYGYYIDGSTGLVSFGDGTFYISYAKETVENGEILSYAVVKLYKWTDEGKNPMKEI